MTGSPCQDMSIAGKQEGADEGSGTRSSLMYETLRIVEKIKPKVVIWENVRNLLGAKHRHNFENYIKRMADLGYRSDWRVLSPAKTGWPQNRERIFTISVLDDREIVFPQETELITKLSDLLEKNVEEKFFLNETQVKRIENSSFNSAQRRIQEKDYCDCLLARDYKDPKCVVDGGRVRKITPREYWRI